MARPRKTPLHPADDLPATGPGTPPEAPKPPSGVLERGLSILEAFNEQRLRLSLRELAELTGLDKATLLRLSGVLVRARMLHRFENGSYALGPATLHMGMLYRSTFDLGTRLQPVIHAVMQKTMETVAFYVRSVDERVCLYRENSPKEIRHHVEVGNRIKLADGGASAHVIQYYSGQGRTPQAERLNTEGYATARSERVADTASVAVPVFESDGQFLGSLVVIGLASRFTEAPQQAAVAICRTELGLQGFGTRPPPGWVRPEAG